MNEETRTPEAAPVATQTQTASMPAKPPRKKKTGCIVTVVVLLVLLLCCCGSVLALGGWQFFTIYSGITEPKPEDLGITYTKADVQNISQKTGIAIDTKPDEPNTGTVMKYEGTKVVDTVLTQAEVSAYVNYVNSPRIPVKDVQIKINNNFALISLLVTYQGKSYPVLMSIRGAINGNSATGKITVLKVAGFTIPAQYREMATEFLLDLINSRLARVTGLNITTFKFKNGRLIIKGTFPAKVWRATE